MIFYILTAIAAYLLSLKTILGAGSTSRAQIHIQNRYIKKYRG